jgi:hypothetical protein
LCCLSFHLPFFLMAIVLSVLPFTLLSDGHCVVCPSIYPSWYIFGIFKLFSDAMDKGGIFVWWHFINVFISCHL